MQFEAEQLIDILTNQESAVEIKNENSFSVGTVSPRTGAKIAATGRYVGVGNSHRIRYLRRLGSISRLPIQLNTLQRIRNAGGEIAAARPNLEHRWTNEHGRVTTAHPYDPAMRR